jgi:hypothetical protein
MASFESFVDAGTKRKLHAVAIKSVRFNNCDLGPIQAEFLRVFVGCSRHHKQVVDGMTHTVDGFREKIRVLNADGDSFDFHSLTAPTKVYARRTDQRRSGSSRRSSQSL